MMLVSFKKRENNWFRKRWLDFRNGHSIYLVFIMTFANFITIQYKLLIDRIPFFHSLLNSIWIFAIIFIAAYIPLSMIIGYWHRKSQWKVEAEAMFRENQIGATIWLFVIDLIDGKVTEEEKKNMREYLSKIAGKHTTERPPRNAIPINIKDEDSKVSPQIDSEIIQKEPTSNQPANE